MIGWEFPPFSSGGLGVHCRYLTEELAKQGVQLTFFMPPTRENPRAEWMGLVQVSSMNSMSLADFLRFNSYSQASLLQYRVSGGNIEFNMVLDRAYGRDFFSAVEMYNRAAAKSVVAQHGKEPFDLIHAHDWITLQAGLEAKRETGLPLVATLHSTEMDRSAGLNPAPWILDLEKESVRHADAVITVSNLMRRQVISELGANAGKVFAIHNGAPPLPPSRGKRSTRLRWKHVVLCHGRLSIQKGADYFLRAAKKVAAACDDVVFVVSGTGGFLPALVELATDIGVADRTMFIGNVPGEHLSTLYECSDVFVMPSVREPFGITALEAMSMGKPVIASKTSGACEVGGVFPVDFWDVEKMASLIIGLLEREEHRRQAGELARQAAAAQTWAKCASRTMEVYRMAVGKVG